LLALDVAFGECRESYQVRVEAQRGHQVHLVFSEGQVLTLDCGVHHGVECYVVRLALLLLALQHVFENTFGLGQVLLEVEHLDHSRVQDRVELD